MSRFGSWFAVSILTFSGVVAGPIQKAYAEEIDVTTQLTATYTGYVLNRRTNTFDDKVTLSNPLFTIRAPIKYVITGIAPASVTLSNATGTTPDGKPFINVPVNGGALGPGQSTSVILKFANPGRVKFTYATQILGDVPSIGRQVEYSGPPPVPMDAINELPKNPNTGRPVLMALPQGSLEFDAHLRDPITAVGACTDWITSCLKPGERELDDCARSAPKCATNTPWEEGSACCPAACFEQYRITRLRGMPDDEALINVYVKDGVCFPEYKGLR
jgi:hypothetical protein